MTYHRYMRLNGVLGYYPITNKVYMANMPIAMATQRHFIVFKDGGKFGIWRVLETMTGLQVGSGRTRKAAMDLATHAIIAQADKLEACIAFSLKNNGPAPTTCEVAS